MRHLRFVRGQPVDLRIAVHGMPQAQARAQLQVARLEHALQQQDRAAPAESAHALGLGQVQQSETVGGAQAFEHALDAVAVGVGLDHRPHARIGRGTARALQVVVHGCGVDGRKNGARHGGVSTDWTGAILALGAQGRVI